jgi:arylsulfatase A-like enzyme
VRRSLAALLAAGLIGCTGGTKPSPAPSPQAAAARPGNPLNVLLITVDTLRADHLGLYGYRRGTSPHIDALAATATVFEQAYTYWPKTRASFVMMLTGRRPSQNGYSHQHAMLLGFNPTLASALKDAGYATTAWVDNANVAASLGYGKGFDAYHEVWEQKELKDEWQATRAISDAGVRFLEQPPQGRPFFLWLHFVNPHTPYTPPSPFSSVFLDASARGGPELPVVGPAAGFRGGIPHALYVPGQKHLGYYVAQYDGEIAAADQQIGRVLDALRASPSAPRTLVVFASDHGESLGEHDYYFDHGQDLFDPCLRVPLIVAAPETAARRTSVLASTLDILPTVLDAVKVRYPPDIGGTSLMPVVRGGAASERPLLFAQNDHSMVAALDARFKLVATFEATAPRYALYDRKADPAEVRDVAGEHPDELRSHRRELELYLERSERERAATRRLVEGEPQEQPLDREGCERLRALGYVQQCP